MDITVNEDETVKVSLEKELQKMRKCCDEMRNELKKYTAGLKVSVKEKHDSVIHEMAQYAKKIITEGSNKDIIAEIVEDKVLYILAPIFGMVKDENGNFTNGHLITCPYDGSHFLRDRAQEEVASALRKAIDERIENSKVDETIQKQLNGITPAHAELIRFAKNLTKNIKEELGENVMGDQAAAQLIQTISWEMKAQRDRKF